MRVGLVCPYAWEVPGGVQAHVRDLAEALLALGHEVSVLAPADEDAVDLPPYLASGGRAVSVPFNGSVARVAFGPVTRSRVRRWVRDGGFDVLHVHEPAVPSLSALALFCATGPIVATFHMSTPRSRAMAAVHGIAQPALEKLSARIAVSEPARQTLVEHFGGDPVLIPNGVALARFARARPMPGWPGSTTKGGGTLGFLGRFDEPRKGFEILTAAMEQLVADRPGLRLLVAGPGDIEAALAAMPAAVAARITMLGLISEAEKEQMLRSVDLYVAPNTGGESFGIILTEAMSAGTPVVASDIDAFRRVLEDGTCGALFPVGDADALALTLADLLDDPARRAVLRGEAARTVARYDWSQVAADVVAVYETVTAGATGVAEDTRTQRLARLVGLAGA
ncbi:glycosyltransferase family 4 protein [Sporichthya sp.]|uniref:glycosyltransferase family 4 protein n=1 Tax=Sporichthya sp. TaxID=65475 RepID=UPI001839B6E6|nr:glycosyltransferase family 4 protein [Sporichthya sp.]MBA3741912.1 glycosyltransferase family 4 protein [Sporichthya sp.]